MVPKGTNLETSYGAVVIYTQVCKIFSTVLPYVTAADEIHSRYEINLHLTFY